MALAIFDLDETLIAGNSPSLWGRYLGAQAGWIWNSSCRASRRWYGCMPSAS